MQNKQNHTSRAKLFSPFGSLKGFRDHLKCKKRVAVGKRQLSSDTCEVLDRKLQQIRKGQMVKIIYYDQQEYVEAEGVASRFDPEYLHIVQIMDKVVHIRDIIEVQTESLKNISWDQGDYSTARNKG